MNVKQHNPGETGIAGDLLRQTLRQGEVELPPVDPGQLTERRMEAISLRATVVGPVLEAILQEPHGYARWGLNE